MMVSICMITYNHEKYIQQAVESVLDQETNFDFELIIANDNSPDKTSEIINKIIENHKNGSKINFNDNIENLGMMPNFVNALQKCKGKYVAMCEGDDYWTNNQKLQKQVDFLEDNEEFAITFHKAKVLNNEYLTDDTITIEPQKITTIYDLAKGNYMHTCTVLYRNNLFESFPEYFIKAPIGDYFLHMLNSQFGKIYYLEETMAVYRVHDTSYWSSKKQQERIEIWTVFITNLLPLFDKKVRVILKKQIKNLVPRKISFTKKLKIRIKKFLNL